jgi:hypothetical protein
MKPLWIFSRYNTQILQTIENIGIMFYDLKRGPRDEKHNNPNIQKHTWEGSLFLWKKQLKNIWNSMSRDSLFSIQLLFLLFLLCIFVLIRLRVAGRAAYGGTVWITATAAPRVLLVLFVLLVLCAFKGTDLRDKYRKCWRKSKDLSLY